MSKLQLIDLVSQPGKLAMLEPKTLAKKATKLMMSSFPAKCIPKE